MAEHKTNVSKTSLPVSIITANMLTLMRETASLKTLVLSSTTLTLMMETKQVSKQRFEVLKALQSFKTSVTIYQSSRCNIAEDFNPAAKTLVFGSTISTLLKEV
jgi:hypothetical protein